MEPDIIAKVCFSTPEEGGRQSAVTGNSYGVVFMIDGQAFDGRLLLSGGRLDLGVSHEVPVKFLNPQLVLPLLSPAQSFTLWEGKVIATGSVVRILRTSA